MGNTTTVTLTKITVDAKVLIDGLLDALSTEKSERWDKFDRIGNAIRTAEENLDSPNYTPEERRNIDALLGLIKPSFDSKNQEYAADPAARKKDEVMGLCRDYMRALGEVQRDISRLGVDSNRYTSVVSQASLFYAQNWQQLSEGMRRDFSIKLESVRSKIPGRRDYIR